MPLTHQERIDRRKNIASAVKKKKDIYAVARSFGVSVGTARQACMEYGIEVKTVATPGRQAQKDNRHLAAKIIEDGGTITDACSKTNLSSGAVYNACYEFGITIPGKINNGGQLDRKENRRAAIDALRNGETVNAICEAFNLSYATLRNACVEFGVPLPKVAPRYSQSQRFYVLKLLMNTSKTFKEIATETETNRGFVESVYRDARLNNFAVKVRKPGKKAKA